MAGDASAYAALGLEPGADPVAIERAYKQLIKLHHPDREGGDAKRAAEINRAYRELRSSLGPRDTLILADDDDSLQGPARSGWVRAAMTLVVALAALLIISGPVAAYIGQLFPTFRPPLPLGQGAAAAHATDAMEQPLHLAALNGAVRDALRIGYSHDGVALISASRDCHRRLRLEPSVTQLDRCAAFDDAVVQLQDRDPMWDQGPFSQLAVTGRQWSAASALSNDYLAIDSRLDRIRVQVELALAPPESAQVLPPAGLAPVDNEAADVADDSALALPGSEGGNVNRAATQNAGDEIPAD
jgi:hypothetical protein